MELTGEKKRWESDYDFHNFNIRIADVQWSVILTGAFMLFGLLL